jgi:hypothetical protein
MGENDLKRGGGARAASLLFNIFRISELRLYRFSAGADFGILEARVLYSFLGGVVFGISEARVLYSFLGGVVFGISEARVLYSFLGGVAFGILEARFLEISSHDSIFFSLCPLLRFWILYITSANENFLLVCHGCWTIRAKEKCV